MSAGGSDQEKAELDAALTEGLRAAQKHLDSAEGLFKAYVENNIELDRLTPLEMSAYVSARAELTTAHAAMAAVRSQIGLRWQLEELTVLTLAGLSKTL